MQSTGYARDRMQLAAGGRVETALRQRAGGFQPSDPVIRSWTRCLQDYGLDPDVCKPPPVLTSAELGERRERLGDLISCAALEMTTLYHQLGDTDLAVVLTDAD